MSDFDDDTPIPLRDIAKHADLGLNPDAADGIESRARARFIRQAHVERRPLWRRRAAANANPRPIRWFSRRAAVLSVGVLVAGGTAVAATTPWDPILGNDDVGGHATAATTTLPAEQAAALGVLRREQTDADRSAGTRALLNVLGPEQIGGVHTDGIRLLQQDGQDVSILVPTQRADDRRNVLCVVTRQGPGANSEHGSIGQRCSTPAEIADGRAVGGAQYAGELGVGGLVPDGVDRVEIPLTGGPTLTADVHNNYFLLTAKTPQGTFSRGSIRLLAADGKEVARVGN